MTTLIVGQSTIPTEPGQDSVNPAGMQKGNDVYAGYGLLSSFADMVAIKALFPGKKYVEITPRVGPGDCLDIETGDAVPADAPLFIAQWHKVNTVRPVIYANASTMPEVKTALASVPRTSYFLWVAQWDGNPAIPAGYDAKQYASTNGYDSDTFDLAMWPAIVPPPVTHPVASAPPGRWEKGAIMVGLAENGEFFMTFYNVATGKWSTPLKLG